MELFAVFKVGVYRHECGGIFSTLEAADKAAETLIAGERDDWHAYEVVPFTLDAVVAQTSVEHPFVNAPHYVAGGELIEPKPVSRWTRTGDKVAHAHPRPA